MNNEPPDDVSAAVVALLVPVPPEEAVELVAVEALRVKVLPKLPGPGARGSPKSPFQPG